MSHRREDPPHEGVAAFVEAVLAQLTLADQDGSAGTERYSRAAEPIVRLVNAAAAGDPQQAAREMLSDLPLLAAAFQNVDILHASGYPGADAVSLAIMAAIAELEPPR